MFQNRFLVCCYIVATVCYNVDRQLLGWLLGKISELFLVHFCTRFIENCKSDQLLNKLDYMTVSITLAFAKSTDNSLRRSTANAVNTMSLFFYMKGETVHGHHMVNSV